MSSVITLLRSGAAALGGAISKSFGPAWLFNQPDGGNGSPTARLSQPYAKSLWIQRAITLKAGEIAAAPLKFYDGDKEVTTPELVDFWKAPFIGYGKARISIGDGQAQLAGWLDLAGECFILRGDDWLVPFPEAKGRKLSPLIIARPDRMRPIARGTEFLGWEFTDGDGRRWPLLPEQVERVALWNPYDEKKGLAPAEAIFLEAESEYLASLYVRNLMRNNGDQGVYVVAKGAPPTDPQIEQITEQLRLKRSASLRGDFRPVFLAGDITVEDAKAQVPEAGLNAGRILSRHAIFIGLGVPASMADVQQAYSIGSNSDRALLITSTCMALAKRINAPLGRIASAQVGRTLEAESDWDEHPVMQAVRRERLASAKDLWDRGMPWKEINDFLDLGMKTFKGWEIAYVPFSAAPLTDGEPEPAADPVKDPALAESSEDPALKAIELALLARRRVKQRQCINVTPKAGAIEREFAMFACDCHGEAGVAMKARSARELAQWRDLMTKRRATVRAFESAFTKVLMLARAETLKNIAAQVPKAKAAGDTVQRAAAVDLLFDLAKFAEAFGAAMARQQRQALGTAGKQFFTEVGKDDPFTYPPEAVLSYLSGRASKLKDTPPAIYEEIKATIEEGLVAGDTQDQLSARVRQAFNGVSDERARRIALTETGAAYGAGRDEAMVQAGVQYKRWLTSGGDNVRSAHADANGQTVTINEAFTVGGEALMYPGDEAGSAENVINCHCVSVAVASGDAS